MTAPELIAELRALIQETGSPQDVRVIFSYLATKAIDARLAEGQRICDVSDVIAWLRELADAAKDVPELTPVRTGSKATSHAHPSITQRLAQARWERPTNENAHRCPDCFHVHTGRYECSEYLGEGRFCKCGTKVPA